MRYDSDPDSDDDAFGFDEDAEEFEPLRLPTDSGGSVGKVNIPPPMQGFRRPPVPEDFFDRPDGLSMMNIDVQYDMSDSVMLPLHPLQKQAPRVLIYGVTPDGHSALIIVHGFYPYCYFQPAPEIEAAIRDEDVWAAHGPERLEMIRDALDNILRSPDGGTVVLGVSVRWGKSIDGYTDENRPFLKVTMSNPESVGRLRTKSEPGRNGELPETDMLGPSFESNIPFVSRYMIDRGMGGAMWTQAPHGKYTVRKTGLLSHAQIEVDVLADNLKNFSVVERGEVAETRAIYFDIEMAPEKADAFPDPDHAGDQINMIACNLITLPSYAVVKRVVLALDKCTAIPDKQSVVMSFGTESDLLLHFCLLVRVYDPDWLFGYNSINFDMKSIITRIRRLGLDNAPGLGFNPLELGRRRGHICVVKVQQFESGAIGKMKYHLAKMHGRNQYDVMLLVRRDVMCRFKSYSLDAVTRALKVRPKGHMPYEAISVLQRGRFQDELRRSVTTADWFQLMQVLQPEYINDKGVTRLFWRPSKKPKATVKKYRDSHPTLETWAANGGFEEDFPAEVMGPVWKIIHRNNIAEMRNGKVFWSPTASGRALIADYCADDAICTTEIDQRRMYTMNHMELGRLCYIGMMPLLTQGQQVRIISVIMRAIQDSEYLIPYHRPVAVSAQDKLKRKKGYKGATVVSPFIRWFNGYEDGHIAFMDFSGLYPSIIMAFNLCYSTWVRPEDVERYKAKGVLMRLAPNGEHVVHESVRRGVLPSILEAITLARGTAKKGIALAQQRMKELRCLLNYMDAAVDKKAECLCALRAAFLSAVPEELHPEKGTPMSSACAERCDAEWHRIADVLGYGTLPDAQVKAAISAAETTWSISKSASDAKQNAIKVVANSVYGFTGAQVGKLPRQEVSSAVTAYGRMMIDTVIRMCESSAVDGNGNERYAVDPESPDAEARGGISPYLIRVLYGDTDSAAAHLVGCKSVMDAWRLGKKIAAMLTGFFRRLAGNDAITLELEKVCDTELQMGKKRYAKREWKKNAAGVMECVVDAKGYEVTRRDNPPIVQRILSRCAEIMFPTGHHIKVDSPEASAKPDVGAAIRYVHDAIRSMLRGEVSYEDYTITKAYSKEKAAYAKEPPAHIQFLDVLRRRGRDVSLGQRIPYVYVASGKGTTKTVGRIEDPDYARENGLPIDVNYYIEHNLIKPLVRFFSQIVDRKSSLDLPRKEYDELVARIRGPDRYNTDECKRIEKRRRVGLEAAAYKVLFTGEHMRSIVQSHVPDGSIFARFVRDLRAEVRSKLASANLSTEDFCLYYHIRRAADFSGWMDGGGATRQVDEAIHMLLADIVPTAPPAYICVQEKLEAEGSTVEGFCEAYGVPSVPVMRWLDGNTAPAKVLDAATRYLDGSPPADWLREKLRADLQQTGEGFDTFCQRNGLDSADVQRWLDCGPDTIRIDAQVLRVLSKRPRGSTDQPVPLGKRARVRAQ